jgi:hypothetical protein
MNNIVIDLDGTLADITHRLHLMQAKDWEGGNALLHLDGIHEDVARVIRLATHCGVIVLSARNEKTREATRRWLDANQLYPDHLLLRPEGDYRPDHELKLELLARHFGSLDVARREVWVILEDRTKVVEAYRNAGFNCWQVRETTY